MAESAIAVSRVASKNIVGDELADAIRPETGSQTRLRVFVGSSSEAVERQILNHLVMLMRTHFTVLPWNDVFSPGLFTIEGLLDEIGQSDAAVLVFAKDDILEREGNRETAVARDNVVFECGLFLGSLGRDRVIILEEEGVGLPSDVFGLNNLRFDQAHLKASLGLAVDQMRKKWNSLPPRHSDAFNDTYREPERTVLPRCHARVRPAASDGHLLEPTRRLEKAIEATDFRWSLCLVGDDHAAYLSMLANDLRGEVSETGEGKHIKSGLAYWGVGSTVAWFKACMDPMYPVMRESIEYFHEGWDELGSVLTFDEGYQYVSLGPGDGQKDRAILSRLLPDDPGLSYVPIDMSLTMLRLGIHQLSRGLRIDPNRVIPVQLDFSDPDRIGELRELLNGLIGDQPVLFSLLGNTLANFENDVEVLTMLNELLLRPKDRLLLEVATTSELSTRLAEQAAEEYGGSGAFRLFVTSALHQFTDLTINLDNLRFLGTVERDRSLLVKMVYMNRTEPHLQMTLPDRTTVGFPKGDTIRLHMSRKYERHAFCAMLSDLGLATIASTHRTFRTASRSFGFELLLLEQGQHRNPRQLASNVRCPSV